MEVALLRKVNEKRHSGIVEVLEWFECADCFLVVMARPTPVMDLFDYVSKRKRLNEAEARFVSINQIFFSFAKRKVFSANHTKILAYDPPKKILAKSEKLFHLILMG